MPTWGDQSSIDYQRLAKLREQVAIQMRREGFDAGPRKFHDVCARRAMKLYLASQ